MERHRLDTLAKRVAAGRFSRRRALGLAGAGLAAPALVGANLRRVAAQDNATPAPSQGRDPAAELVAMAREAMTQYDLRAVILRVTIDGEEEVVTTALGESMTGVPATTDMHFRNGAVAIAYIATLLLRLVDQQAVGLDDPLSTWLPDLPDADQVTPRMLVNMTSGYNDHAKNPQFVAALVADPFRQWTPQELIELGLATPRVFAPGTNWDYSHAGYVILGQALERIAGKPLDVLMQEQILAPLGLRNTVGSATPAIPGPVLHSFSAERRDFLGIPAGTRFLEESTFWNPSWTIAAGAVQTTDIYDMATSAVAVGEGTLLSPESHAAQVAPDLLGFGAQLDGCQTCHTLDEAYNYGLGVKRWGSWIVQDPTLAGYDEVMAYLPGQKIAVAVVVTYREESFAADAQGNFTYGTGARAIATAISNRFAPEEPLLGP